VKIAAQNAYFSPLGCCFIFFIVCHWSIPEMCLPFVVISDKISKWLAISSPTNDVFWILGLVSSFKAWQTGKALLMARRAQRMVFLDSSAVEQSTVNRSVASSNLARGATFFILFI
jgi:hypothetical protein